MHPLLVYWPTFAPQKSPHPSVTVAGVLPRELDHPLGQPAIPFSLLTHVALARPGLSDHPARPTLGDPQPSPNVLDGGPPPGRAQKFPRLTSFRMSMSTACSATIFFRRAFSDSSSLRRFIASPFMPPWWLRQRWKVASLMPSLLATSGTEVPAASSASAWRSLRTICSGVCLFFIENPPSTHLGRSDSYSNWISFRGAGHRHLDRLACRIVPREDG